MSFFKTKLFILIMILVAGATFYHFGDTEKLFNSSLEALDNTPLEGIAQKVQNIKITKSSSEKNEDGVINSNKEDFNLEGLVENAGEEFSQLSSRTQEVKEHAENILGATKALESAVTATESDTPLHERALEYGKYMYCKQVVEDYEVFNNL